MKRYQWKYPLIFFIAGILSVNSFAGYTLGNWSTINYLNVGRMNNSAATNGQYIWTIGGYAYDSTPYPVEYAQIMTNGALGPWSIESTNTHDLRDLGLTVY